MRLLEALLAGAVVVPAPLRIPVDGPLIRRGRRLREFSDGSRAECDLLVGVDGIYSIVHTLVFGAPPPCDAG